MPYLLYPAPSMANLIPGFSIIKNKVITPLLVATERVVEQLIPDPLKQEESKIGSYPRSEDTSDDRSTTETRSF